MNKKILSNSIIDAGLTTLYIILVVSFLNSGSIIFGDVPDKSIYVPIIMLLTLVVSASITGFLVLGRPILWYWDGIKKEAVQLFVATLAFLIIFAAIFISIV